MKVIKVGLLGMGTVGGGVFEVLKTNGDEIARRAGCRIEVVRIAALDVERVRALAGPSIPR